MKSRILFLCTGNSCRSQMAEAIVNERLNGTWQAFSAGTKPTGEVHPKAIEVLSEIGIDHKGYTKSIEKFKEEVFDLVVTVCDSANEQCPVWLGKGERLHRTFPDPAVTDEIEDFRRVRDDIEIYILALLEGFNRKNQ